MGGSRVPANTIFVGRLEGTVFRLKSWRYSVLSSYEGPRSTCLHSFSNTGHTDVQHIFLQNCARRFFISGTALSPLNSTPHILHFRLPFHEHKGLFAYAW